jgi:predicted amidohydrolase
MDIPEREKIVLHNIPANSYKHGNYLQNLALLETHLQSLEAEINYLYPFTQGQKIRGIVVAPEYFFSRGVSMQDGARQYSEDEARDIQARLSTMSVKFPEILIIPGTVAWQKNALPKPENPAKTHGSIEKNEVYAEKKMNQQDYFFDKKRRGVFEKHNDPSYYKYLYKSGDSGLLKSRQVIIASEVAKNIGHTGEANVPSNDPRYKLQTMLATQNLDYLLLSRNTVYFYLNGERRYKYNKRSDYQEVIDQGPNVFIQGLKEPIVRIEGITFGIEICLDHACNVLGKFITQNQQVNSTNAATEIYKHPVDVHLILSDSVQNQPRFYCMERGRGYLIHSSTNPNSQRFLQSGEPRIQLIKSRYSDLILTNTQPHAHPPRHTRASSFSATSPRFYVVPNPLPLDPRPEASAPRKRSNSFGSKYG